MSSGKHFHNVLCLSEAKGMDITMIDFEEEIQRFKPSLEVEAVSDAIIKSDLTDMADIMMEIMKEIKEK